MLSKFFATMLTGQDVDERIVTMQKSVQTGKVKKPKCFYHPENEKYSPPAEKLGNLILTFGPIDTLNP